MTAVDRTTILALADDDKHVDEIATAAGVTPGYVYAILRKARPGRARKPRTRVSTLPDQMRALAKLGTAKSRIAELLKVSRAYVYRVLESER